MTNKNANSAPSTDVQIEEALSKTEQFFHKNGKKIIFIVVALVVVVAGYLGYESLVKKPAEKEAYNASFVAQQYFAEKDMQQALNGDGTNLGFAALADKFSSTKTGNVSNHYAGACYLHLGDYQNAINSFKKFKPVSGMAADVITAQNYGMTGDAYSQLNDYKSAIEFYKKASSIKNDFSAPYYLKKSALVMLTQNDKAAAKDIFNQIKTQYPNSFEGRDIEKYIGQCE